DVTTNAENTDGGEVAENAADGDANTKWLTFTTTGWLQFKLAAPRTVVTYALTSANDEPGRDPQDWTLSGSPDGATWTPLDSGTCATRPPTRPSTLRSPTARTCPSSARSTSTAPGSARVTRATPRRCTRCSGMRAGRASARSRPARPSAGSSSRMTRRPARPRS